MTAEAITVEAEGPYVVVKGERRAEHEAGEGETKRTERTFGTFYRRVALPETAKLAEAEARYGPAGALEQNRAVSGGLLDLKL